MKKLITLLLAIVTVTALAADFPKGSPAFKHSATSALNAAKKEGKPVILVFSAAWCPPCQAMKKDVYPSAAVKEYHDKFVWAYLDTDDQSNRRAADKAGVSGIPHIQFLDSSGKEIHKQVGGTSPESFAKTLKDVLAKAGPKS
ncbi:MAG: thioredoxin family protein [Verrucomicrobiaceae bacterium]|nr:thioredoxin family protein [Verrucomicrobiaceae bacterium]